MKVISQCGGTVVETSNSVTKICNNGDKFSIVMRVGTNDFHMAEYNTREESEDALNLFVECSESVFRFPKVKAAANDCDSNNGFTLIHNGQSTGSDRLNIWAPSCHIQ